MHSSVYMALIDAYLPEDVFREISQYIPMGSWKNWIFTCKFFYGMNSEEKVDKRSNHLMTIIQLCANGLLLENLNCSKITNPRARQWSMYYLKNNPNFIPHLFKEADTGFLPNPRNGHRLHHPMRFKLNRANRPPRNKYQSAQSNDITDLCDVNPHTNSRLGDDIHIEMDLQLDGESFNPSHREMIRYSYSIHTSLAFIRKHITDYDWNWDYVSANPNLTLDFVKEFPDKQWNMNLILSNSNIQPADIVAAIQSGKMSLRWRSNIESLSKNPNLTWRVVQKHPKLFCYDGIAVNWFGREKSTSKLFEADKLSWLTGPRYV